MAWTKSLRELHEIVVSLYRETSACKRIAESSGLDTTRIVFDGISVRNQWHNVLGEADRCEKLGTLVDLVAYEYEATQTQLRSLYGTHLEAASSDWEPELSRNGGTSPFQHACFISYSQAADPFTQRIVTEFYEGLRTELSAWRDETIYLDESRLAPQYNYDEGVAAALCRSACMVIVFTPKYFNPRYIYCVREYRAMEELEDYRLKTLGASSLRYEGLIIPVVFRGDLPNEICSRRTCHEFNTFSLSSREMYRYERFARKIKEIAEYIDDRCNALASIPEAFTGCEGFTLPTMLDVQDYLLHFRTASKRFPMR